MHELTGARLRALTDDNPRSPRAGHISVPDLRCDPMTGSEGFPHVTIPDAALIRRILEGDIEAYGVLMDRYQPRFARFATRLLGTREDAEEALQDTFVRAFRSLGRYQEREQFASWFFRILVNRCRTSWTRQARRDGQAIALAHAAPLAADSDADRIALREELQWGLAQLPLQQREAFLLHHVEELSYEEMASVTGVKVSALKMRVTRATARLRELLTEKDNGRPT